MDRSTSLMSLFFMTLLMALSSYAQQTASETMTEQCDTMNNTNHDFEADSDEVQDEATTRRYQSAGMIKLFIYPSCPYCQRVMAYLRDSGNITKVAIIDASIPKYLAELKRLTNGNTQCPFIVDYEKNVMMHESQDIVKYFMKRFAA